MKVQRILACLLMTCMASLVCGEEDKAQTDLVKRQKELLAKVVPDGQVEAVFNTPSDWAYITILPNDKSGSRTLWEFAKNDANGHKVKLWAETDQKAKPEKPLEMRIIELDINRNGEYECAPVEPEEARNDKGEHREAVAIKDQTADIGFSKTLKGNVRLNFSTEEKHGDKVEIIAYVERAK